MSDALASLRTALAPKAGMKRIPLALETYQYLSVPLSSKLLMNMYAEQEPSDARTVAALLRLGRPSSGGRPRSNPRNKRRSSWHYLCGQRNALIWPEHDDDGCDRFGDIGTPSGGFSPDYLFYSIAVGPNATEVCSPPNAYVSIAGGPVAQITTTWPSYGASSVAFLDGDFVFTGQTAPGTFFITKLEDPQWLMCCTSRRWRRFQMRP